MNHSHIELIVDPQWVSYCVENECSFRDHIQGYVCRTHCSRHVCSGSSCSLIRTMVTRTRYQTGSSEYSCPVADLLVFHKPQLEFRGPYYEPAGGDSLETGYGAIEYEPGTGRRCPEADVKHLILKASLPVTIALFSTVLTKEFGRQYEIADRARGSNASSSAPSFSWMAKIFELAEVIQFKTKPELRCSGEMSSVVKDAALKSTVAMSTLFSSRDDKINRFMKKVTCKYNDKHATRADFYTMVVMLALCLFPYLKHRVLGDLFNDRTLVIMCFDKTRTRHNQWSTLSTHIHLHMTQPEFVKRVLVNSDLGSSLPVVVTVTLEKYISDAIYSDNKSSMSRGQTPRDHGERLEPSEVRNQTDTRQDSPLNPKEEEDEEKKKKRTKKPLTGKRKTPCSTGYYEKHEGRLEEKVTRLQYS